MAAAAAEAGQGTLHALVAALLLLLLLLSLQPFLLLEHLKLRMQLQK